MVILICSCSQDKSKEKNFTSLTIPKIFISKSSNNITLQNNIVLLDNKKYSGYLYELFSNSGDTLSVQAYFNGRLSGSQKKWYSNKNIMEERTYLNGKKNGRQVAYWENGNKKFEYVAKDDAYEGQLKEWSYQGDIMKLANYKNGQEDGTQKLWYESGKIRANYVVINGKRYGLLGTKNCVNVSDSIFVSK